MSSDVIDLDERRRQREGGWAMVLAFDTDDPEFARGVEVGTIYETLRNATGPWTKTCHASNAEMCRRVAAACGFTVEIETLDEHWVTASFTPTGKP